MGATPVPAFQQSSLCNDQNAVQFVNLHVRDAAEVAKPLDVSPTYILALSAAESGYGRDWNASNVVEHRLPNGNKVKGPANNFFSLQGGASAPFADGIVVSGGGTVLSAFPSYKASAQSFAKQFGALVMGKADPSAFARGLVPRFNSGTASGRIPGNPKFVPDLTGIIGSVTTRLGCK
jgi:hypothetical protein